MKYLTNSDKETVGFGQKLGTLLSEGDVVALTGELGSGKTWFTKGLALGLGIGQDTVITSPSFALVNEYRGRHLFYHIDLYRLEDISDIHSVGIEEYLYNDGVVVMEWADRWPEILPEWKVEVKFKIIDDNSRDITVCGSHPRSIGIVERLGTL
ncbi:tRNA (adenosine(37)-N6)-threonylcarbamoyltransferase complex ATPase subunit type 1 TsaE [Thermodesulfobacteriota bacterium]